MMASARTRGKSGRLGLTRSGQDRAVIRTVEGQVVAVPQEAEGIGLDLAERHGALDRGVAIRLPCVPHSVGVFSLYEGG